MILNTFRMNTGKTKAITDFPRRRERRFSAQPIKGNAQPHITGGSYLTLPVLPSHMYTSKPYIGKKFPRNPSLFALMQTNYGRIRT